MMVEQYNITGGDHGNYTISLKAGGLPVAFVRRNKTGGGYTVRNALDPLSKQKSIAIQMRNMPAAENGMQQANQIMQLLLANEDWKYDFHETE